MAVFMYNLIMNSLIYTFLISLISGLLATLLFETILKTNHRFRQKYYKNNNIVFGLHFHHSIYGVFCIVISMLLFLISEINLSLIFIAFGIGIILMHTISERRFIFVERRTM